VPEPEEGAGFDAFLEQEEGKVKFRVCENAIDNGTDSKYLPPDERVDGLGRYVVDVIDNDGWTKENPAGMLPPKRQARNPEIKPPTPNVVNRRGESEPQRTERRNKSHPVTSGCSGVNSKTVFEV